MEVSIPRAEYSPSLNHTVPTAALAFVSYEGRAFDHLRFASVQVYSVKVMAGEQQWQVDHRYSEFRDLHLKVRGNPIEREILWQPNSVLWISAGQRFLDTAALCFVSL